MGIGLLILRLAIGPTLAFHGLQKLFGWLGGPGLRATGLGMEKMGFVPGRRAAFLAGLTETGAGFLLALGLATPAAAALAFSVMLVAGIGVHFKNGFSLAKHGYEYTLVLGLAGLSLAFTGPGPLSLDALFGCDVSNLGVGLIALLVGAAGAGFQLALRRAPAPTPPLPTRLKAMDRRIVRTTEAPMAPGFLGGNHLAAMRVSPEDYARSDPFFLLMDDNLDAGAAFSPMGEAHPHAGFETVTFILDGTIRDRHEGGVLEPGDLQWMTAGRGVIHSEDIEAKGKLRILQLWLILPRVERWTAPGFQEVRATTVPVRRAPGVELRLYSGSSGTLRSLTRNHVPVTLADIRLQPGATFEQELPAAYNGFLFAVEGSARVGPDGAPFTRNQMGWLDRPEAAGPSFLKMNAGDQGARLILYAGQPQGDAIVSHGPFIGDTREDIARLFSEYRSGRFARMSELAATREAASASSG